MPFCHAHLKGARPLPPAYPQVLVTVGDHLRKRRLDLGLLQCDVADQLGADHCTVTNWELNHTEPELRFLPGIVRLLGYVPWVVGMSVGDRLLAYRRERGFSQEVMARWLGIDPGTLSRWERGGRIPTGRYTCRAEAFLEHGATKSPSSEEAASATADEP